MFNNDFLFNFSMKALILAAGKGIRMGALTQNKPKVLVEVAGRPFLYYTIKNLQKAGISNIGIVVEYKKEKVFDFAKKFGFNLSFIEQPILLGTGDAVIKAKDWIGKDNFIVVMGDNLYSENDLKDMSNFNNEFAYVAAFKSSHPQDYGVLEVDGKDLLRIEEKPQHPKSDLVNTGLYKLTSEIFPQLMNLEKSPRGEIELTDALTRLASLKKVKVYPLKDYWIDMSVKEDLPEIEKKIKELGL